MKTECLILSCDNCSLDMEGDGYVPHYDTESDAKEAATESDWTFWKGHYWCWNCIVTCTCGHVFTMHDHDGGPCEDEKDGKECPCQGFQPKEVDNGQTSES